MDLTPACEPFLIHHLWTQGPTVQRRLLSCGDGDSGGDASMRMVNVASTYASMAADTLYLSAVIGAANAPEVAFLNEDDSPPLVSSNARICLVHGVQGLENTKLTLTINLAPIDAAVAFGQASQSVDTLFMLGGSANPFGDVIMDR